MKITNTDFLDARKDKKLSSFVVIQRNEDNKNNERQLRTYMRLCIKYRPKYAEYDDTIFIENDAEITVENYSQSSELPNREINQICFHNKVYHDQDNHVLTFLNAIKKDSEIKFRVVAFNGYEYYKSISLVAHQLYGVIDGKCYFLSFYVGEDNTASPVR